MIEQADDIGFAGRICVDGNGRAAGRCDAFCDGFDRRSGSAGNDDPETFGRKALAQLRAKPPVRSHSDHDRCFHRPGFRIISRIFL